MMGSFSLAIDLENLKSVKDFGAAGDGTTDDTAAFNNALATGGNIYLPDGTYIVSATLNMDQDYTRIFGGRGATISPSLSVDTTLEITADHCRVEGIRFIGPFSWKTRMMGWLSLVIEALLALPAIIKALRDVIRELKNEGMTIDRSTVQDDIKEGVRRRAKPKR